MPVEAADDARPGAGRSPFERAGRTRRPKLRLDVTLAVFVGGCVGGWLRYAATSMWPAPAGHLPWATFGVNVVGAFILALVVVIAADIAPSRYLRPLVGTGFCGALTTFSSVVVTTDQLSAHHPRIAAAYLGATIVAGLAASSFGLVLGRAIAANRHRARTGGDPR
jgi:fluoride exporter